ncbi:AAA family ATPase [Streptomyces sp. NPDC048442]|uniref:DnaB-like helicase N-terminal domain-containing protein n=1 Tax=Streptomyces sp. NPDC048442 TaxID=3154823 RepID=UPI003427E5D1
MNPRDQADPHGPEHLDAERYVLGDCMHDAHHIPTLRATLDRADFSQPAHELVWDVLGHLHATGQPTAPLAVQLELEKRGELQRAGGAPYVAHLADYASGSPQYYAEQVRARAELRAEADLGRQIVQYATRPDAEPGAVTTYIDDYQKRKADRTAGQASTPADALLDWSSFFSIDFGAVELLPGRLLAPGQQITVVGEGKAGKSLFVQEWMWRMATGQAVLGDRPQAPVSVLYVDAENGHQDIQERMISYGGGPGRMGMLSYASFPPIRPLDTAGGGTDLLAMVNACEAQVVCLDTVSRFISGPENESDTWLSLYRHTLLPLKRAGIASVRLDHMGKDTERGARGSSAKTQDVDHVWELRVQGGGHLLLNRTHTRTGIGPDVFHLVRHAHKDGDRYAPGKTRHVLAAYEHQEQNIVGTVEWLITKIDGLGLPNDAGNPRTISALATAGIKIGKDKIATAVRTRKNRDNLGSPESFPETFPDDVPRERSPGTSPRTEEPQVRHSPGTSREPQGTPPSPPSPPLREGKGEGSADTEAPETPLCTVCHTPLHGYRANRGYDTCLPCDPTTGSHPNNAA